MLGAVLCSREVQVGLQGLAGNFFWVNLGWFRNTLTPPR